MLLYYSSECEVLGLTMHIIPGPGAVDNPGPWDCQVKSGLTKKSLLLVQQATSGSILARIVGGASIITVLVTPHSRARFAM